MSEFEVLLENLLEQKPEFTRQDVEDRVRQKKEKIDLVMMSVNLIKMT